MGERDREKGNHGGGRCEFEILVTYAMTAAQPAPGGHLNNAARYAHLFGAAAGSLGFRAMPGWRAARCESSLP